MKTLATVALVAMVLLGVVACKKGASSSETAKKLMAKSWKYDTNANLASGNESLEGNTGISSNIQLGGDVGAIADFASETLVFGEDKNGKGLAYQKKYGSGIVSTKVMGFCELKDNDKVLVLKEWDGKAGKEKEPVEFTIKELTEEKLVLVNNKTNVTAIYTELKKFNKEAKERADKEKQGKSDKRVSDIPEGVDESKVKKDWKKGDKLEIYWKGTWFKGNIVEGPNGEGQFKIHYDNYKENWDEFVDVRRLREIK